MKRDKAATTPIFEQDEPANDERHRDGVKKSICDQMTGWRRVVRLKASM